MTDESDRIFWEPTCDLIKDAVAYYANVFTATNTQVVPAQAAWCLSQVCSVSCAWRLRVVSKTVPSVQKISCGLCVGYKVNGSE